MNKIYCNFPYSKHEELNKKKICKYIHDGLYPSWTLPIYDFLKEKNYSAIIDRCEKNNIIVNIIYIPHEDFVEVNEKVEELGLKFIIKRKRFTYEFSETYEIME